MKNNITTTMEKVLTIDLTECIPDLTANLIAASPDHYDLPPDIFESLVFEALNDLIDDFVTRDAKLVL